MISQFNLLTSLIMITIVIVCLCNKPSTCQINYLPNVNCPNVFQYSYWGSEIIGIISLDGLRHGKTKLVVELSQPGAYNLDFFGKLSLNVNEQKAFEYIEQGRALTFKVQFPLRNIIPKVTSIEVNGIQICTGSKYDLPSTTIKLEYTLTTFPPDQISSKYDTNTMKNNDWHQNFHRDTTQHQSVNSKSIYNQESTTLRPLIDAGSVVKSSSSPTTESPSGLDYINSICGRENLNYNIMKLNVKGTIIRRSRFPWISAVFKRIQGDFRFQCGGSLISTRTVISAAHCFYSGFESIKPEDIIISMGLHDLTSWLNAKNFGVEKIIQHPDYKPTLSSFDADIAVVRLIKSVTLSTSIRPICMWPGTLDTREIEGTSGAIVGWGADEQRNTTIVPTLVKATVVSEITCLRSNFVFLTLTSNRTLCAGNLDGSGPCIGDSGNGLMIKMRNKWLLRGTVSAALGTQNRQCILDQYTIYSDIAKFSEWIYLNMLI